MSRRAVVGWVLLIGAMAGGCASASADRSAQGETARTEAAPPHGAKGHAGGVFTYGSLPALGEGRTEATIDLDELVGSDVRVGVGSLSGLRGEVLVVERSIWVSYPDGEGGARAMRLAGRPESATFLALSGGGAWQTVTLHRTLRYEDIPHEAERLTGADRDGPRTVPIHIEGTLRDVRLNVVDGPALQGKMPTREALMAHAAHLEIPEAHGAIVGFFSNGEAGDFIHPGDRVHLHVVLPEQEQMGHLDGATILPGSKFHFRRNE